MIGLSMYKTMLLASVCCMVVPPFLSFIESIRLRRVFLICFIVGCLYLTAGERLLGIVFGARTFDEVPQINLTPFWSYAKFHHADIRWQVYMNVFLFIPFGFMLPWASERLRKLWKVIVIAAVFSALTEAAQYFLRIGLCETDDVIHNTLGAVIGYGYWRLLMKLRTRFRGDGK